MNIILSAILMAVIIYLLPVIAFVFIVVFNIMIEPIKIMNSTWGCHYRLCKKAYK